MTENNFKILSYELGGFRRISISIDDRPFITVSDEFEKLGDDELISRARRIWQMRDNDSRLCSELSALYPNAQIIIESFCDGVGASGKIRGDIKMNGRYAFVLKNRRARGYYQILDYRLLD